ncbi:baseplate J/gp47 family protein [Vibrio sp. JC009]|uniref:baseplate J/gp47 family protein n=1 Tax=Vibrio sp. JC009 TaxID=2912314 RepID=UPI0023B0E37E|nr:baseplate J/gp47 family protein [Vibrio sp. JC009]WED23077.1 baseplate J/gp47 family protein [Vibrio sp. JC009]
MKNAPEAFQVPDFETLLKSYIDYAVEYCAESDEDKARLLRESLENDSELLAQITQAFITKRQAEIREQNYQALQMFRKYVTETDMVDMLAMQYGLKRQVLVPEDDSVYPPIPAVMESDEDLLRRFDLAPYQFHTTGTRLGYKFHSLTLDERPLITIDSQDNVITMRYEFPTDVISNPVKDAEPRMLEPNSGKVEIAVLSRETENGLPSAGLLDRVKRYLTRDDIGQETDEITTKSAVIKNYQIHVDLYTGGDPNHYVTQEQAEEAAWSFAKQMHRLETTIDREEVGHVFYALGAKRAKVVKPAADVVCSWDEAPYCTEVKINVRAE